MTANKTTKNANPLAALPPETQAYLHKMRGEFATPGTRLGHLARAFGQAARDLQLALDNYGSPLVVKKVLGQDITAPIAIEAELVLRVSIDGAEAREYAVVVQPAAATAKVTERRETPLTAFPDGGGAAGAKTIVISG